MPGICFGLPICSTDRLLLDASNDRVRLFVHLGLTSRRTRDRLDEVLLVVTYQCFQNAFVQWAFKLAASKVLLVVVLKTLPVSVPLAAALLANLGDAGELQILTGPARSASPYDPQAGSAQDTGFRSCTA